MELGYVLAVAVSGAAGFAFRGKVSRSAGRTLLALGCGALMVAVGGLWLTVVGWGPFGAYTAGLIAVILFALAGLTLPFGLVVYLGKG